MKTLVIWKEYFFFEWEIKNPIWSNAIGIWDRELWKEEIKDLLSN